MTAFETIETRRDDGVLTVTLARPDRLNAYTATMGDELGAVFAAANADDAVRVIVVTGKGRGFCAGADISAGGEAFGAGGDVMFGPDTASDRHGSDRPGGGWIGAIRDCLKPSIAAINGPAIGVGFTMTLPMDIRIAAHTARFGPVFTKLGLVPEAGAAWYLPRVVGLAQAMHWCLTAEVFDAAEALRGRLVSEVTTPENLLPRAHALARRIADHTAPVATAMTRQLFQHCAATPDPAAALAIDARINRAAGHGRDVPEGVTAMLEKRAPQFPGTVTADLPEVFRAWLRDQPRL